MTLPVDGEHAIPPEPETLATAPPPPLMNCANELSTSPSNSPNAKSSLRGSLIDLCLFTESPPRKCSSPEWRRHRLRRCCPSAQPRSELRLRSIAQQQAGTR